MVSRRRLYEAIVVGGGVAGGEAVRGLLHENACAGQPLSQGEIAVVEPSPRLGVGPAWDDISPKFLTNMTAPTLRVAGPLDATGTRVESGRVQSLVEAETGSNPAAYVTRGMVGDRLAAFFDELRPLAARSSIGIDHVRASATRIELIDGGFRVTVASGERLVGRSVILALGLLAVDRYPHLRGNSGYRADAWRPRDWLETAGPTSRIAVVGMGPTAIDWALRLSAMDRTVPVLMTSRTGHFPAVRPLSLVTARSGVIDAAALRTRGAHTRFTADMVDAIIISILERFGVTRAELSDQAALLNGDPVEMLERTLASCDRPQPLFEALKALDELAPTIWRWSTEAARDHILSEWSRPHTLLSYAIPPSNARALLALLNSGKVVVRRGLAGIRSAAHGRFELQFDATGPGEVHVADAVVNATGFSGPLESVSNPLVRTLLAEGLLAEAPYGGAEMDFETGEVLRTDGSRIPGLFIAGGSLTRSAGYVVNSLLRTSEHGLAVGMACARFLRSESQGRPTRGEPADPPENWSCVI